jgi:hypothetical protein
MSLSPDEQQKILKLASGELSPESGMEKHFMMVLGGKGRACSPKEKEWFAYWSKHNRSSSYTGPVVQAPCTAVSSRSTTSEQPIQPKEPAISSASTSFLGEFDTPPDIAFEDEVVFEEVREKLNMLLSKPIPDRFFGQQLAHINEALKTAHTAAPPDIAKQLQIAEIELAPF